MIRIKSFSTKERINSRKRGSYERQKIKDIH